MIVVLIGKVISLFPQCSYTLDAPSVHYIFLLLLKLYLEVDDTRTILKFNFFPGFISDKFLIFLPLFFLFLLFRTTGLKTVHELGVFLLFLVRADLLNLFLAGGDVADTWLRSK